MDINYDVRLYSVKTLALKVCQTFCTCTNGTTYTFQLLLLLVVVFLLLSPFCCRLLYKAVSELISNLPIVRVGLFLEIKQKVFVIRVGVSEALVEVKDIYIMEN